MYRAIIITNNINDTDVLCNILIGVSETIDFINNGAFLIKTKITIDEINISSCGVNQKLFLSK